MITLLVACRTCKVYLNIGQSCSEYDKNMNHSWDSFICTDEVDTMSNLNSFTNDHVMKCHEVIFSWDGSPYIEELCKMKEYKKLRSRKLNK